MSKVCQQKLKQNCLSIRFKHLATMYGEEASTIRKPLTEKGYLLRKSSVSKQLGIKIPARPSTSPLNENCSVCSG